MQYNIWGCLHGIKSNFEPSSKVLEFEKCTKLKLKGLEIEKIKFKETPINFTMSKSRPKVLFKKNKHNIGKVTFDGYQHNY